MRRAIASRAPDLLKTNGGGANAILARIAIEGHRYVELTRWPERRVAHGVRFGDGGWVANLHATLQPKAASGADVARAVATRADAKRLVLGGDFNLRRVDAAGFEHIAGRQRLDTVLKAPAKKTSGSLTGARRASSTRPTTIQ